MTTKDAAPESGMSVAVGRVPPLKVRRGGRLVTLTRQAALAERLKVTQQAVSSWERRGWAPMKRVAEISKLTGVPMRELMPPTVRELVREAA